MKQRDPYGRLGAARELLERGVEQHAAKASLRAQFNVDGGRAAAYLAHARRQLGLPPLAPRPFGKDPKESHADAYFRVEAERRETTASELKRRALQAIADSDILAAVLDE